MKWLCPASFRLLNHITPKADFEKNNNFCRVKVVTQGIPARYNRNEFLTLGFANTPHADVGDALDDKCQGDAERVLREWKSAEGHATTKMVKNYMSNFVNRHRLGVPTCCGYEYHGKLQKKEHYHSEVFQYFVMDGLRVCGRIRNNMGSFFFGHTFCHNTSVAMAVVGGAVHYTDPEFRIFAWGSAGK